MWTCVKNMWGTLKPWKTGLENHSSKIQVRKHISGCCPRGTGVDLARERQGPRWPRFIKILHRTSKISKPFQTRFSMSLIFLSPPHRSHHFRPTVLSAPLYVQTRPYTSLKPCGTRMLEKHIKTWQTLHLARLARFWKPEKVANSKRSKNTASERWLAHHNFLKSSSKSGNTSLQETTQQPHATVLRLLARKELIYTWKHGMTIDIQTKSNKHSLLVVILAHRNLKLLWTSLFLGSPHNKAMLTRGQKNIGWGTCIFHIRKWIRYDLGKTARQAEEHTSHSNCRLLLRASQLRRISRA